MNLPIFQTVITTDLELPLLSLIVGLLILCGWLGYRLKTLRRGISGLSESLNSAPVPPLNGLPASCRQDRLGSLARMTLNAISEAELQSELAKATQRIQMVLLDQVDDALFVVDGDQEVRFANRAARNLFGTKEFIGRSLIEVCLDHQFAETVELAMTTEGPIQDQVSLVNDSRTFLIESGKIDKSYEFGEGAWLMIRDITAQMHTERVRQDFVANASHELRTPLSIIKGYLEMMKDEPEQANAVRTMLKHTDRLARIVDDMLMISRIESPESNVFENHAIFDIGDCVYDMIDQLQPMIEGQKAEVNVMLPPEPKQREFFGDRFYWDQIFFNLIENALKQNPNPELKVTVMIENSEGRFNIKVIDNGIGIPTADLEEIFKRFYRVDKSHAQTVKGTGLGLSIVKRAVEAHHGSISVTSRPGEQTCFLISLPGPPAKVLEKTP